MNRARCRHVVRIELVRGDITEVRVDAVVNAANSSLLGGGGVDGAIHRRGGPEILAACRQLRATRYPDGLPTGQAVATTAGRLPARWVIHTVGPVYAKRRGPVGAAGLVLPGGACGRRRAGRAHRGVPRGLGRHLRLAARRRRPDRRAHGAGHADRRARGPLRPVLRRCPRRVPGRQSRWKTSSRMRKDSSGAPPSRPVKNGAISACHRTFTSDAAIAAWAAARSAHST